MKAILSSFAAALMSAGSVVPSCQAAQPLTKVVMTTGSFSEREAVMYVARDQGFFRRYGLDLMFVHVRSGPVGMAALAGGDSQLHEGSVTGAVLGAAAEGTDLVFVAGMINKLIGNIMASPMVKTPSDLKGKIIGVTSASGGSWMFTTLALEYWSLDAKRDGITFHIVGDESVRSQALFKVAIDATHLATLSPHRSGARAAPTFAILVPSPHLSHRQRRMQRHPAPGKKQRINLLAQG